MRLSSPIQLPTVGWSFHARRDRLRRPQATIPAQCLILEAGCYFERDGLLSLPLALEQWHRGFASVESGYKTESFKASPKCIGFIRNKAWENSSLRVLLKTMVMVVMGH